MYKKIVIPVILCIRFVPLACLLLMSMGVFAQKYTDVAVNNRVILNKGEYIIYAELVQSHSSREVSDDIFYYWYSANEVKRTQGGYDGKLLHGKYTEFYSDKDLKVQGKFSHGVKTGQWKMWHTNGNLSEIQVWRSSGRRAKFESFDENGNLIRRGSYRYEKLHGIIKEIGPQNTVKRKYRDGIEVIKAKKAKPDTTLNKKGDKKRKFALFKIRRHKKDTASNSVKEDRKIKVKKNSEVKNSGAQEKNRKSNKDITKPAVKSKDELPSESHTTDSKKKKRRKKKKSDTTNSSVD